VFFQELIRKNVKAVIKNCPRALFIFDEVDKMPPGVLDALVPFIHHPGQVLDGYNYKQAMYVFLSNSGANDITKITRQAWHDGRKREELHFKDFEQALSNEAFNSKGEELSKKTILKSVKHERLVVPCMVWMYFCIYSCRFNFVVGGLYKSRVIDKVLVDFFVPFLPLERQHVLSCIKVEANRHKMDSRIIDEEAE